MLCLFCSGAGLEWPYACGKQSFAGKIAFAGGTCMVLLITCMYYVADQLS